MSALRVIAAWLVGVGIGFGILRLLGSSVLHSLSMSAFLATVNVLMFVFMNRPASKKELEPPD